MLPPLSFVKRSMSPPQVLQLSEELVVDDGIKTLGLHSSATCRERSVALFGGLCFMPSYYFVYQQSQPFQRKCHLCLVNPLR